MKIVSAILAAALALPAAAQAHAQAQSIDDTHVRVWHPAGKTPALTYRPRAKSDCVVRFDDRRADKTQHRRCVAATTTKTSGLTASAR